MQTLHSVLKRGGLYWDRAVVPEAELQRRLHAIQAAIAASGDDAWLLYGDAQRYGSVAYVSHFLPRTRSALVLVPREGQPTLLASVGARDIPAAKTLTWMDDVRPFTNLPRETVKLLTERELHKARIGLAGARAALFLAEWTAIQEGLPAVQWEERDDQLEGLRIAKSSVERAAVKAAADLVTLGLSTAAQRLRAGESVRHVTARVDGALRRQGAEDVRLLLASGEQVARSLRPPDDRVLKDGDVVLVFIAVEHQRYWAEGAQTFVLGAAPDNVRSLARQADEAVQAMQAAARPGVTVSQLAGAAQQSLGDGRLIASASAYGLGHGIGLDAEEPPFISEQGADARLVDGSSLALHVVLHGEQTGAIFGQTVTISEQGAAPLLEGIPLIECGTSGSRRENP